jgi:molybdopterin-guanine dinucleotide biosynthesis protein B
LKVFGFAGYSGSGKTTLIEKLIPIFVGKNLKVALIKHAHHEFDLDQPGKDSYRHREAGCVEVLVTSSRRWAVIHELRGEPELGLEESLKRISPCDLVLVEGFKKEPIPKIEIYRTENGKPFLYPEDSQIVAVASDGKLTITLPQLDLNQPQQIAEFILSNLKI